MTLGTAHFLIVFLIFFCRSDSGASATATTRSVVRECWSRVSSFDPWVLVATMSSESHSIVRGSSSENLIDPFGFVVHTFLRDLGSLETVFYFSVCL